MQKVIVKLDINHKSTLNVLEFSQVPFKKKNVNIEKLVKY